MRLAIALLLSFMIGVTVSPLLSSVVFSAVDSVPLGSNENKGFKIESKEGEEEQAYTFVGAERCERGIILFTNNKMYISSCL